MSDESQKSIQQLRQLMGKDYDKKRFIRTKEGVERYQIGKTKFLQMARDAGALYKINRTCLIEVEIFEEYLNSFKIPAAIK